MGVTNCKFPFNSKRCRTIDAFRSGASLIVIDSVSVLDAWILKIRNFSFSYTKCATILRIAP